MTVKENIPSTALKVSYYYDGFNFTYHVWESRGEWYWLALGNSGSAESQEKAMALARRWIKDSQ